MTPASLARRVARLRAGEWAVLAEALATAAVVEVRMRTWPMARLVSWAQSRPGRRPRVASGDLERLMSLAAWPDRIPGWPTSCLRRSLVLTAILRRRQVPAELCVGVRREGEHIRAHAWVACGDLALGSAPEPFEALLPAKEALSRSARWSP